jgi:hypothetical protein
MMATTEGTVTILRITLDKLTEERDSLLSEVTLLKSDQNDWRKGVELIASALGESDPPNLSCVRIAENALKLRAKLERLAEQGQTDLDRQKDG